MRRLPLLALLAAFYLPLAGYLTATATPKVRTLALALPGYPPAATPLKLALLSDIHVAGPDMPPARVDRIVGQVNALGPDVVLLAGDFISDKVLATRHYPVAAAVAPLGGLRPRIATIAVLGNHDKAGGGGLTARALSRQGIIVLRNDAVRAGPLAIGGIEDPEVAPPSLRRTLEAMARVGGVPVVLAHIPNHFGWLPPSVPLMLSGHTHCSQIRLPNVLPFARALNARRGHACGRGGRDGKTYVVTAGLGTSLMPLRIGAPPDLWLITVGAPR